MLVLGVWCRVWGLEFRFRAWYLGFKLQVVGFVVCKYDLRRRNATVRQELATAEAVAAAAAAAAASVEAAAAAAAAKSKKGSRMRSCMV